MTSSCQRLKKFDVPSEDTDSKLFIVSYFWIHYEYDIGQPWDQNFLLIFSTSYLYQTYLISDFGIFALDPSLFTVFYLENSSVLVMELKLMMKYMHCPVVAYWSWKPWWSYSQHKFVKQFQDKISYTSKLWNIKK